MWDGLDFLPNHTSRAPSAYSARSTYNHAPYSFIRLADYLIVNTMHVLAVNSVSTLLNYLHEHLATTPKPSELRSWIEDLVLPPPVCGGCTCGGRRTCGGCTCGGCTCGGRRTVYIIPTSSVCSSMRGRMFACLRGISVLMVYPPTLKFPVI